MSVSMTNFEKCVVSDMKAYVLRIHSVKGTNADYLTVYHDFCRDDGNYSASQGTKLYEKHSSEYCALLQVLANNYESRKHKEE